MASHDIPEWQRRHRLRLRRGKRARKPSRINYPVGFRAGAASRFDRRRRPACIPARSRRASPEREPPDWSQN
jgi:hypothetical protein